MFFKEKSKGNLRPIYLCLFCPYVSLMIKVYMNFRQNALDLM
jgi:hypothetical protein